MDIVLDLLREREIIKNFLAKFAGELHDHNYNDAPHGPDLDCAAETLFALLAQPQEKED